ncbi:MAG: ABC transporter ATP-binding protein/permease [Bacteroidales bacterium]|jgi:subfamily B ATP-binding cassette protein MsbA|nr:ABC transporter ATP-binding protein/permease [Bacteroidales bacterium]
MKDFLQIIKYIKSFKLSAIFNIFFNLLASFFTVFSFALAIPFLGVLFETQPLVTERLPLDIFNFSSDSIINNFYYFLSKIIIENGKVDALFFLGVAVIIFTLFKTLFMYLANHFMVPLRNGVVRNIRNELYQKVVSLHIGYFTEEKKGNIMSRMSNDVQEIEWGIMSSLEMLFRDPIRIVIYLGVMIYISWELTVFAFVLLIVVGLIIGFSGKNLRKKGQKGQAQVGNLMALIEEMIGGLRIIKAFNAEKHSFKNFEKENNEYTKTLNIISRIRFIASPLTELFATFAIVVIMWFGGKLILDGKGTFSPQQLIGYLVIFSQIIVPGKSITTAWYNIKKAIASVDRINDILNAKNTIQETQGNSVLKEFSNSIEYQHVNFSYTDISVLSDINLKIIKGQTIALIGHSGSGKSTLIDLIPRFYDITSGKLLIDGIDVKEYNLYSLRDKIGYVNQNPILFNDTIFNNIAFGMTDVEKEKIIGAARIANAHDFIMATENGYDTNIGDGGCRLSGGQRQRLSIARAILKNPPILILDEATSALDTESEKIVQEAIENLMKDRTSIVIAHRLSTIKHADLICVLENSKIVEMGTHEALIAQKNVYYKLYNIQNS